jgi:3-oxocholest-4-en-26-oyl-CoA dehydrogenase beta subunit
MDLAFSDEQTELRDLSRRILSERVTPERLTELEADDAAVFDRDLWRELADAGLLGAGLPSAHGGGDAGLLGLLPVLEELGRHVAPVPFVPTVVQAALTLVDHGTDEHRSTWLPRIVAGAAVLTAALEEPGGLEPTDPRTIAVPEEGGYRVTGEKHAVPYGAEADRILVPAASGDGLVLLLLDPVTEGVTITAQVATNRQPVATVELTGALVPSGDVLATPGVAAAAVRELVERGAAAWCAVQAGICQSSLRAISSHTAQRHQFGKPIAEFQAVAQRAADAYIDAEMVRLTARQAVFRLARGWPATPEVHSAKFWAGDGGMRVVHAAMHLHGGLGVSTDHPLHRRFLWAKQVEHSLGTPTRELARLGRLLAEEPV